MTESDFKKILSRYETGECTAEERKLIESWLDSHYKETIPFKSDTDKTRTKEAIKASVFQMANIHTKINAPRINYLKPIMKIAASIVFIISLGVGSLEYYEYLENKKYSTEEVVSSANIQKILLSDGSIVWLKPNSSMKYPKNFKKKEERIVSITGEALFEIEKDPGRPFIVHSGELTTKVLGTSFNINARDENIEVVVLTGKVSVTSNYNNNEVVLQSQDKALYNVISKELAKEQKQTAKPIIANITRGTEYDMKFEDTSLKVVIQKIEKKFEVVIKLEDESLYENIITADLTSQSLDKTLDIISKVLSTEYKINDSKITLKTMK
ncbi:MAG: FecR family protein [Desulfitobacteriaceae bacterium]|nr:FecR family protein [Desulfitobacteriaceae bacterium]